MVDKLQQGKFDSFTIVNNGLIETDLLTEHEKMVYIVIRKHLNQEKQTAFPGMATIARESRISKSQVLRAIKGLEEKGLLIVKRQTTKYNEKKTNIYRFNDFADLWKARTVDELKKIATETSISLTDDEIINKALQIDKKKRQKLYNQLAKEFEKEKGLDAEPTKAQSQAPKSNNFNQSDTTTNSVESQDLERYTIDQIKQLFDYDNMLINHADRQHDIDTIMGVLHTAMNTGKSTIRIYGEDKPAMIVIAKLMKLDKESIMYAIDKFSEQSKRIKNPTAYLLTILYNAPEQYYLDKKNHEKNEMSKENCSQEEKKIEDINKDSKNSFVNFKQRTYDYDSLEKELLNRQNNS